MRKAWTAAREHWGKMKKRDRYISIAIFSLTWYTVASLTMTELVVVAGIKIFRKDDTL